MMAGSPCRYYRLTDLLRLAFSAYDDTVAVQQGSLDWEHNPVAESAHIDRRPGGSCTTMFWSCSVKWHRSDN